MANPPRTPSRTSALFAAAARGNLSSLRIVLEHGVGEGLHVDSPNSQGDTPLHEACRNRQWPIAAWLLAHGADPDLVNAFGQDASDVCPDAAAKDIYASILASNPIDASNVASLESTLESARARRAQEGLAELGESCSAAKRAGRERATPARGDHLASNRRRRHRRRRRARPPSFPSSGGPPEAPASSLGEWNPTLTQPRPRRRPRAPSPRMSAIDAAMESAMKRAQEVLRASPEDLLRAVRAGTSHPVNSTRPRPPAGGDGPATTALAGDVRARPHERRRRRDGVRHQGRVAKREEEHGGDTTERIDEEIAIASSPKERTSESSILRRFARGGAGMGRSATTTLSRRRTLRPRRRPAPATPRAS